MKTIHFYDKKTLLCTYDFTEIFPDPESGEYFIPEGATELRPVYEDGRSFYHAKWDPKNKKWVEGGVAPEPTIPEPTDQDYLKQQNAMLLMQVANLEAQNQEVAQAQADMLMQLAMKGVL